MEARRTPWYYYLVAALLGLVAGLVFAYLVKDSNQSVLGSSWAVPIILGALGIVVLILAWAVRKYAKGQTKYIEPRRAFNTLVLAKSLAIAGTVLAGWYLGQILIVLPRADVPYYTQVIISSAVSGGLALFDVAAGVISEYWCQLPPNQGPEHPQILKAAGASASSLSSVSDE